MNRLSKEIQTANDEIEKFGAHIQKLKDSIRQKDKHLTLIDDNVKLRNFEKELDQLEGEKLTLDKLFTEVIENESSDPLDISIYK